MCRGPSCSNQPHLQEHWRDGEADVKRTLAHPDFRNRQRPDEGVAVFDLTK